MGFQENLFRQAIALSERGRGFVSPNPEVGSIIVKNGFLIGEGWHERFGEAHAEVNAVHDAEARGFSVEGADIFVTLEPCAHQGKTPSCARFLVKKKIRRVFILFRDPNPLVSGKGKEILENAGIEVVEDAPFLIELRKEYETLFEIFSFTITHQKPFFAFKLAQSINGAISEGKKERTLLTGPEAELFSHDLRQKYDAVLVGKNTVLADNPSLGVRMLSNMHLKRRDPKRILLDPHFSLKEKRLRVFRDENFFLVVAKENAHQAELVFGKERILALGTDTNGFLSLPELSSLLFTRNISSTLIEGGAKTIASFLQADMIQKAYFITAPKKIICNTAIFGIDPRALKNFRIQKEKILGSDALIEGMFEGME